LRLVLVLPNRQGSPEVAKQFESYIHGDGEPDSRLHVHYGCITKLNSRGSNPCAVIVNSTNWRFKATSGTLNRVVNEEAGKCLEAWSHRDYKTAKVGLAYPVQLADDSRLREEGVTHVIQTVGPNLSPNRPDCLADVGEAERLLAACYDAVLKAYYALTRLPVPTQRQASSGDREGTDACQPAYEMEVVPPYAPPTGGVATTGNWKKALLAYLEPVRMAAINPNIFYEDARCVVLYDKYPKARFHLLLIPKARIDAVADLRREHVPELEAIKSRADWVMTALSGSSGVEFRAGFHAVPSLSHLHLHIISQDFESTCLKNKQHWNSFTSKFFMPVDKVLKTVAAFGRMTCDKTEYEDLLKGELRCHRCCQVIFSMPALKRHVAACKLPVQDPWSFH
jgi:aprataxin